MHVWVPACMCVQIWVCLHVCPHLHLSPAQAGERSRHSVHFSLPSPTPAVSFYSGPQLVLWLTGLAIGAHQQDI